MDSSHIGMSFQTLINEAHPVGMITDGLQTSHSNTCRITEKLVMLTCKPFTCSIPTSDKVV